MKAYTISRTRHLTGNSGLSLVLFLMVSLALIFSGCSDNSTGAAGNNNNNNNNNNEIGNDPTFANVQMIFQQNCGTCHIGSRTSGVQLDSYENVIESVGNRYGREVVQPGNAADSPLIDKIESDSPEFGSRMPQGRSPLSTERINQIKEWIDNGAENN